MRRHSGDWRVLRVYKVREQHLRLLQTCEPARVPIFCRPAISITDAIGNSVAVELILHGRFAVVDLDGVRLPVAAPHVNPEWHAHAFAESHAVLVQEHHPVRHGDAHSERDARRSLHHK